MYSTMLRCLQCPDILRNICEQAYEGGYDSDCRTTVSALSLTCRALHPVAKKILWSRLFGLRSLVKTMPPDVWQENIQTTMCTGTIVSPFLLHVPRDILLLLTATGPSPTA